MWYARFIRTARILFAALAASSVACASHRASPRGSPPPAAAPSASATPERADAGVPAPTAATIGGPYPITLIAASAQARWVAFCEARQDTDGDGATRVSIGPHGELSGDRLMARFALASGETRPIDALAAADPSGRWVVVRAAERLLLIDALSGKELDLSELDADVRADATPFSTHRALAFDAAGSTLAYVKRASNGAESIALRDLASGRETRVQPDQGSIWRIELEPSGKFLLVRHHLVDGNGDGRLSWPAPTAAAPAQACSGPIARFHAWEPRADPLATTLVDRKRGTQRRVDGFVTTLGSGIVVRESDGRLMLVGDQTSELAPASCGARVIAADLRRRLLVVACSAVSGRPPLELVGPGLRQALDIDVAFLGHDLLLPVGERLVALYPAAATALFDFETRRLIPLDNGDAVVAIHRARALVRRSDRLIVYDVARDTSHELGRKLQGFSQSLATGALSVVPPLVVDLAAARVVGSVDRAPLALARDGRVLSAVGGDADADRLALGPLAWQTPAATTDTSR